jgi:hypothetical protein
VAAVSVLFYRDDTGRSLILGKVADRLPQRGKGASSAGRQVVAGVLLLSAMYCVPLALYGTLRVAHLTHPSYDRWSYTETKVYDPEGVLQKAGKAGPFYR